MKINLLASCLGLALVSSPVFAYDYTYTDQQSAGNAYESIYAGSSIGILGGDGGEICDNVDLSCLSWKAFAGYRPNEHYAIEAGYHSLLDTRSSQTGQDIDVSALSLSILGFKSLRDTGILSGYKDVELFGKLGMAAWDSEVNHAPTIGGTDFLIGGGAQMKLNENLGLRGELEYFGGDVDSTNYNAGLTYSTF